MLKADAVHSTERSFAPTCLSLDALEEHAREVQRLRSLRRELEATIEEMNGLLDSLDADPDLEDTDGDVDLAGSSSDLEAGVQNHLSGWNTFGQGAGDECEDCHDGEAVNEDGGNVEDEGEPTLGWTNNVGQASLGSCTAQDGELEPSLCGLTVSLGSPSDLEGDGADDGGVLLSREQRDAAIEAGRAASEQLTNLLARKGRSGCGNLGLIGATVLAPDGTPVRVTGYAR